MGLRIFEEKERGECVMYCSTTDWAFGPVMPDRETAQAFIDWLPEDARTYHDNELEGLWAKFFNEYESKKLEEKNNVGK